jgi:hypothetical protein
MPATPITDPVTGESLVGTEPQLQQQVDPGWWRKRLNLYTGRTLTVSALDNEQNYRGGLLATLGQAVTAGTVSGLALTMDTGGADPMFSISPGYGLMANGQDVALNTTLKTHLSTVTVIDPLTGTDLYSFRQAVGDPTNSTYAGILLLQPVIAQVSGQELDTGSLPTVVSGNLGASCNQDPAEYAFEDWQIADAVRLVYLPWPAGVPDVTNLQLPPMEPQATWRNRLAYAIFEAEAMLGPDDQLPWAMLGVPVALIAFGPGVSWGANTAYTAGQFITDPNSNIQTVSTAGTSAATEPAKWNTAWGGLTTDGSITWVNSGLAWQPLFVDCSAVVRAGGLPRNRYVLPSQPAPLLQWQPLTAFGTQPPTPVVIGPLTPIITQPLTPIVIRPLTPVIARPLTPIVTQPVNPIVTQPLTSVVTQPLTSFDTTVFIIDTNSNVQVVTTSGKTGAVPPLWRNTYNQTTPDGSVVWTNNGPASWQPNTVFNSGQFIFDGSGNQQQVLNAGISGSDEPDWNGIYLPTTDGTVTWINNGTGNPPLVQRPLAQARINQLSEQLSQVMAAQQQFTTLADIFATLPPSGILPASAVNFSNQTAPWFPPNWTISAAPVFLEELETVLETGMLMDPIAALTAAPANTDDLEPVEVLVPLPDAVYDPNILVVDTVPQVFYQEVSQATQARNLTLQQLQTVQEELNTLFTAIGPNVPANPNLIDPDTGLTADELAGRNAPPSYSPTSAETFGTVLQSTWEASSAFSAGQFVIDSNGAIQVAQVVGGAAGPPNQTALAAPDWNTTIGQTTSDGVIWVTRGNAHWQADDLYTAGQLILDSNGNIQQVNTGGTSGASAPTWTTASTSEGVVTWTYQGTPSWQPNIVYQLGTLIVDSNNNIQTVATAGTSGTSAPQWNPAGQTTSDGTATWNNLGYPTWQPNYSYSADYVIFDSNGNIQTVTVAGTSGSSAPTWNQPPQQTTQDGLTWSYQGNATWSANTNFAVGALIVDSNKSIQQVQTAGSSGTTQPAWNETPGATTPDASITWLNNGPWAWQPNTAYVVGQFVVDPQGFMQQVSAAGTSASSPPVWLQPATPGTSTTDGGVTWKAGGKAYWQPNQAYATGQAILDANLNIQLVQTAGTSQAKVPPQWDPNFGQPTQDGGVLWTNLGHATWQANATYNPGQAILDSTGSIQIATTGGISAASSPIWLAAEGHGQTTPDGIIWQSGGSANWESDYLYATGQLVLDAHGNIQMVQTGGISGDSVPTWNMNVGQTTQDSGVVWNNLGRSQWRPNTNYFAAQGILDSNGNIQIATIGGTSGAIQPNWTEGANATTLDVSVTWSNVGLLTWQQNTPYRAGQIIIDSNGNLQLATVLDASGNTQPVGTPGQSGGAVPVWNTTQNGTTTDGNITWVYLAYYSTDLQQLQTLAAGPPYTTAFTDSNGVQHTISLLSQDDLNNLTTNGLQALITSLNARVSQANDLLDTAFLTAQTDIYRFRNYVLGASAATALATSSVLANIATGETASATAENLQNYISAVLPPPTTTTTTSGAPGSPPTTTTTTTNLPVLHLPIQIPVREPVVFGSTPFQIKDPSFTTALASSFAPKVQNMRSRALSTGLNEISRAAPIIYRPATPIYRPTPVSIPISGLNQATIQQAQSGLTVSTDVFRDISTLPKIDTNIGRSFTAGPTQIIAPGQNASATTTDITNQSPLAGAQLNLRTLTIAQRLQQSPSQEAMFYAISNRLSFLQTLQTLENDLNLVADDLPILVDDLPTTPPTIPGFVGVTSHTFSEFLAPNNANLMARIQSPYLASDASEATLFSVGVRVVEQHTMLLRALEARVQQYSDFVTMCTNALQHIRNDIQQAQTYVTQLTNNLLQERQNVAFTSALLADEVQQVQNTNAQRQQVLATSVQLIAYTRARTLEATDTAPSRQLVPASVTSPVPTCLQQSIAIPPELREIIGQLREAPVNWLPSANSQVSSLERPPLLQELAMNTQARAVQLLQMPQLPSSATGETGTYASTIAHVYTANQQLFRGYQIQRASVQPAALTNMSWSQQVASVQNFAAVNDLISADSVHTEVSNAVARLIQQISSVATCLYTRVSIAQPIDRLTWAEYLRGTGLSVQLQSLAVLPGWNQLAYTDRQQMQLLVDFLFGQIDQSNSAAMAFMSDVVRTSILLASDVPVDNIIPGNIIARVQPAIGGTVSLSLPSDRISSGMYVNLYSGATLAARGVVSDLDSSTVKATVTDVFTPGAYLDTTDTAHFTTMTPQAVALRPLFM